MNNVVVFRHAAHEGPGYFADFLQRRHIPHKLVRIDAGDPVPKSLDGISGLVFMGGPMSVNDALPWIPLVTRLIQTAVDADIPVLGHCLGGQLMAKALGAPVTRNPVKEIGWYPVSVAADSAVARAWLGDLPSSFDVYHWHGETFAIPAGATRLLASAHCVNQGFVLGKHLALQCHIEMTPALIADWVREVGELKPSPTVQSGEEMLRDVEPRTRALHRIADILYENWLHGLR